MPVTHPRRRLFLAAALAVALATPLIAYAYEDAASYTAVTSSSGASSTAFAVNRGTVIVLQSQTCNFHYRCCAGSTCVATQGDFYVKQYDAWPVPLTSGRTYCAVACDGTTSGTVYPYAMVVP